MRERLVTLGCALAALLLLGTMALHGDPLAKRRASLPTTLERGDNGLLGVSSWLRAEGVRTQPLRTRFSALPSTALPSARGNLLIVSLPAAVNYRPEEAQALDRWIGSGNTLLVLAALRDHPGWARFAPAMASDLELLTELRFAPPTKERKPGNAAPRALIPNRAHPFFTGVSRALGFSDDPPIPYTLALPRDGFALSLAHEERDGQDAFWLRPHGEGTIIVSGFGSLFSNRALGKADNARLLANMLAAALVPDGTVIFDDEHQGLSDDYDPARFYRDPRLYATLAVILAVWLTWVLGATQLRAPRAAVPAPREAELVRVTGLYLARVVRPAAAARRLLEQFLQRRGEQAGRRGSDHAQLWDWLANHPRLARSEVQQLRAWYVAACAGRRVPLVALRNLIVQAERQLAQ
ncbi:MAG TPA: DUF4350 domain-containing protein [Steroidobacteraceae bacterium]|nr:DUF4350 domain-containing protein [Steroidobacteraceae bacterium]